jgi:signal transduction histidine kinase
VSDGPFLELTDLGVEGLAAAIRRIRDHPEQVVDIAFSFQTVERRCHVEGIVSPVLTAAGDVLGRVAVLRDVTQQQELEQFREELTSMVIHNLQGPLAAVISSLETLRELEPSDSAMIEDLLDIALGSGRKLYSRIESVLWLRRLEDKKLPLNPQRLSLPEMVQPLLGEYRPMAAMRGVNLEAVFAEELPLVVVDEEIIGRVFSNLVDNALKYTPSGGRIEVRATLDRGSGQPMALCAVADTGTGIAKSISSGVFDRSRRGVQPDAGRRRGMGIGLHYCRLAVEAHGGHIWVESEEGQGSTFYFTLPVIRDEAP